MQDGQEATDCLLGLAIGLEYGENAENYKDLVPDNAKYIDSEQKM